MIAAGAAHRSRQRTMLHPMLVLPTRNQCRLRQLIARRCEMGSLPSGVGLWRL